MTNLPASITELTTDNLTALLSEYNPGVVVDKLDITEHAHCGDGLASTADRIGLKLQYREGTNRKGLPDCMKLKTILLHRYLRFGMPMVIGTAKVVSSLEKIPLLGKLSGPTIFTLINIYQRYFPHAPEAMYRNEVNFYGKIRPELEIEAPACYASVINDKDGQFGILMEDLGLRSARFPNAVDGVSLNEMRSLIGNLAKLHARFWESPRLEGDLAWLPTTCEGGMFPVFDAIGLNIIRDQVAKNPFKQDLIKPLGKTVDELWEANWQSQRIIYRQPHTLLHGDTHIGNTYVLPDSSGGLLDFQLTVRGPWCHDLTYLLITGLDIELRQQHERELINLYRDALASHGVRSVPTEDEAFTLYRQSAVWGLVIGWLICPPQNYGETITAANIRKMVTAMIDLDSLGSLEE